MVLMEHYPLEYVPGAFAESALKSAKTLILGG